jgi:uncharacterized integral membrane protein
MKRLLAVLSLVTVVLLAMALAAANAGHRTTLSLGFMTFYRAPVTMVAFGGFFAGMVLMFAVGIRTDLKVRRILRERLVEEARKEHTGIDRNQRDLFSAEPEGEERHAGTRGSHSAGPTASGGSSAGGSG